MRRTIALMILCCIVSLSIGQYVETTIPLPDSISGLTSVGSLVFHSPTNTVYVGGYESFLVAVDARTNSKLAKVAVGDGPHILCSDPLDNKVYCVNQIGWDATVTVIDGATNQSVATIPVGRFPSGFCYNGQENKLYCGTTGDSFVRVIDCSGDSVVAQVPVSYAPSALCYNPQLNRVYCAHSTRDEVSVIDCSADTVVGTIWVGEPQDICYDSGSNCVYTANGSISGTVSVIDCAGDSTVRLLPVGRWPGFIEAGPPGKVYCVNCGDSSISVISDSTVKTVRVDRYPSALSFDAVNNRVYCVYDDYRALVTVIDAAQDTVVAEVVLSSNEAKTSVCCNPAGSNTYVACDDGEISVIGGETDTVEAVVTVGASEPGPLCYSTTNNHLYCLDRQNDRLFIIDGESNQVLRTLKIPNGRYHDTLVWNRASSKVYFTNSRDNTVSILDCGNDSTIATVKTSDSPRALCCSDDGKVYVAGLDGSDVGVIDGSGDTVRAIISVGGEPWTLCYDQTDNKVYVGGLSGNQVSVIDASTDSVVATVPCDLYYPAFCWNQNHDKVYVSSLDDSRVVVIDCTSDTTIKIMTVSYGLGPAYSDSVSDKVYFADDDGINLRIIRASTDTLYRNLSVGYVTALLDNGKQGPANRLYCTDRDSGRVTVVAGYKTDSVLRRIGVGQEPSALAWNPLRSRMYVSNSGSSSITVIRDTFGIGVEEDEPKASSYKPQATVVRGMLFLDELGTRSGLSGNPAMSRAALLDVSGRKVLDLKPGANDVRALAPGVYFIRAVSRRLSAVSCHKVVVTR